MAFEPKAAASTTWLMNTFLNLATTSDAVTRVPTRAIRVVAEERIRIRAVQMHDQCRPAVARLMQPSAPKRAALPSRKFLMMSVGLSFNPLGC